MKLTDAQRRGLTLCANRPTRAILPGHPLDRLEMSYTTGWALIEQRYAQTIPRPLDEPVHVAAILIITTAGRAALTAPIPDTPIYLAARPGPRGDYTTIKALAATGEPEPVNAEWLAEFQKRAARSEFLYKAEQALARNEVSLEERLRLIESLPRNGVDISKEMRTIKQRIERAEKRLRRAS